MLRAPARGRPGRACSDDLPAGSLRTMQEHDSNPIGPAQLELEPALCCLCGVEDVDPLAVGEDFEYGTCPDSFLAVRCRRCRIVFLNPRPAPSAMARIYPDTYHAFQFAAAEFGLVHRIRRRLEARRLLKWCRGLPADARILDVGCGDGFHLSLLREFGPKTWISEGIDADERPVRAGAARGLSIRLGRLEDLDVPSGAYDLVLLVMTIEHVADPKGLLDAILQRLKPGGRLIVVTDNTASPDGWFFRGRHWGGYHFPRHLYLFNAENLAALTHLAGLETVRVRSAMSPVNWTYSFRNLLGDWGFPGWIVRRFSLKGVVALSLFSVVDSFLNVFGRGAILHGVFARPDQPEARP